MNQEKQSTNVEVHKPLFSNADGHRKLTETGLGVLNKPNEHHKGFVNFVDNNFPLLFKDFQNFYFVSTKFREKLSKESKSSKIFDYAICFFSEFSDEEKLGNHLRTEFKRIKNDKDNPAGFSFISALYFRQKVLDFLKSEK